MCEWQRQIQEMIEEIDLCIKRKDGNALSLRRLSEKSGYSSFHISKKFREISGMQLRDYVRNRKLAFALKELRDSEQGILDIALRTIIKPFDCYLSETHSSRTGGYHMENTVQEVKTLFRNHPSTQVSSYSQL